MSFTTFHVLLLLFGISSVCSHKILVLSIDPGISHFIVFRPIIHELWRRNNNLTVVSFHSSGIKQDDNFKEKILEDKFSSQSPLFDLSKKATKYVTATTVVRMKERKYNLCNNVLSGEVIQNLIQTNDQYDVILIELFASDCFLGIVGKVKAPVVGISSTALLSWYSDKFGNINNPSYIPDPLYLYSNDMSFWERLENFLVVQFNRCYYDSSIGRNDVFLINEHLNVTISSMNEFFAKYVNLVLVNSHFSLNFARPLVPGIVEVGGIHLTQPKDLPNNIEKFINESEHGVIYFSLGSMIKGHTLPHDKRKAFLKVFSRLPQRVLWKWENESMPDKPDNVMIQKWMPQFDILSNPNVKAFISHGGLLGTTEAVHCGVPMVVMPQYGDQHTNAKAIEANGGGVILYLNDVNEDTLYESLQKILDPAFQKKAKELSERFRDRPMSPMDTAIYWVEYVARHKGAPHLRTAAVGMPLYQYLLLDVIGFLIAVLLIFMYITYKILSLTIGVVFRKKVKQS